MARPNRYGAEVLRLAEEGYSPKEIASELGCTPQTVYGNWPQWVETPNRKSVRNDKALDISAIASMRREGKTLKAISKALGIPYSTVQRWLSQHNNRQGGQATWTENK